jgi:CRP-like cAMP-binding protein
MATFHASVSTPRNCLLAALPADDLARLWPRLERVELGLREIIQVPDEPITAVYFPESGFVSMMALLVDGNSAEVGIVGFEGMLGLPLLLGSDRSPTEAMVQAPGTFLRLGADAFGEERDRSGPLRALLLRYALAFQAQVTQTAACNGHHALDQRLARWLLIAHDRAHGDEFPMTQEFLAIMLCVHRPGVTIAARLFQQAGLIRYGNGQITITDRAGLEAAACECHGVVAREFQRLLGPARR